MEAGVIASEILMLRLCGGPALAQMFQERVGMCVCVEEVKREKAQLKEKQEER